MKKLKVYLDNCCFNRPFDVQIQIRVSLETEAKLFIQSMITDKRIEFVWSFILLFENDNNPFEVRKESILDFSKHTIDNISMNQLIRQKAEKIESSGLKAKDALHIACAIYAECDYFITTDDRILKYTDDQIKIIDPLDFIKIWEGAKND